MALRKTRGGDISRDTGRANGQQDPKNNPGTSEHTKLALGLEDSPREAGAESWFPDSCRCSQAVLPHNSRAGGQHPAGGK